MPTKVFLTQKDRFRVTTFIIEKFPTAKLDDTQFAELTERELGISPVTRNHIASIRREFDIEPYRPNTGGSLLKMLEELRLRVDTIEESLEVLHRERRENHIRDKR